MQTSIQYIKDELADLYPPEEIEGFVRIIFAQLFSFSYTDMVLQKDSVLDDAKRQKIKEVIVRLKKNEPIQYIFGETEFYDLQFSVKPGVLIPRPETEELVDWIVSSDIPTNAAILDIGTGSGCIALSLKKGLPETFVYAVDVSEEALKIASANAAKNKLSVNFKQADILNWQKQQWQKYDVIVSNPPYVCKTEKNLMQSNVLDYEPELALFVDDNDPLLFYRKIADVAKVYLKSNGLLFFEINESFGEQMKTLLREMGFKNIELQKDIEGKDRMIRCEK